MWILVVPESSQYGLERHERWLAPGHKLTIGRHPDNDISLEGAKSVSKQHLEIEVLPTAAGSAAVLDSKSTLIIKDLGAKFKTHLIQPSGTETQVDCELKYGGDRTSIRLGKAADTIFEVYWLQVVLTLSNIKPKDVQDYCDVLDIKYSKNYIEQTTHVVTNKYNTPKTLQALALQKWIVGLEFVKAMHGRRDDLAQNMNAMPDTKDVSLLPKDAFSDEFGHDIFLPKADRQRCFLGLTFVFFTPEQHKSLDAPIQAGRGACTLYSGMMDEMSITKHVQDLGRPVIIPPVNDEALTEILDRIVLTIQCATMTQGDFIRLLISDGKHEVYSAKMLDAATIKARARREERPRAVEQVTQQSSLENVDQPETQAAVPSDNTEEPKKSKRIGSRRIKPLANFEDDLFGSGSSILTTSKAETQTTEQSQSRRTTSLTRVPTEPIDLFDSTFPLPSSQSATQVAEPPESQITISPRLNRKRRLLDDPMADPPDFKKPKVQKPAPVPIEEEEEFEMAPAAAAFEKTRSRAQRTQATSQIEQDKESSESRPTSPVAGRKRKRQEAADVTEEQIQATLRANKKKAEEQTQAHQDEDDNVDGENLKNLGTVEYFPLQLRDDEAEQSQATVTSTGSSRWDPRWNGRKNFKKFRRATKGGHARNNDETQPSIMIRLVESTPSNRALLDKQWLETAATRDSPMTDRRASDSTQRAGTGRSRASQALFMPADSDSDDDPLKFRM